MRWVMNGGVALCVLGSAACLQGQDADSDWRDPYDSGGPLIVEQAAYDVTYYDLALAVDPSDSTITGTLRMDARMVAPAEVVALDLDTLLAVESISLTDLESAAPLSFRRSGSRVFVELPFTKQPGDDLSLTVEYGGKPRVAPRPPWDGGFQWATTPSGEPWIATSNQMIGADVWWPNKDHVSDKPDSMRIRITVPDPLVVATNGRQEKVTDNGDGTRTYDWFVSTPISNYNVALNIAPYEVLKEEYRSVTGETFPVVFWVLPENLEDGLAFMPEILEHLRWFERTLGPYPFRADKYGVAQTPHLGMEHQSIIAYGANFDNGAMTGGEDWGFDALHHHELSHEWWGNLVTNADWKDMWIHEGFGSYMQALWLEDTQGIERYHEYMASVRPRMGNAQADGAPPLALGAGSVRRRHLLQGRLGAAHAPLPARRRGSPRGAATHGLSHGRGGVDDRRLTGSLRLDGRCGHGVRRRFRPGPGLAVRSLPAAGRTAGSPGGDRGRRREPGSWSCAGRCRVIFLSPCRCRCAWGTGRPSST